MPLLFPNPKQAPYIKNSNQNLVALAFDISGFFDNIDHLLLKKAWLKLSGENAFLPKDQYKIFKNITNYRFIHETDLLKELGLKHRNDINEIKYSKICTSRLFREKLVRHIKRNLNKSKSNRSIGIPQGTPISAFLSNLYLLEFDELMHDYVSKKLNGLYRRYSDDIIIVCNQEPSQIAGIEEYIRTLIANITHLNINEEKTERIFFEKSHNIVKSYELSRTGTVTKFSPLCYLGFTFDGNKVLLKSQSLAKYYRTVKQCIRSLARKAFYRKDKKYRKIFREKAYRFSHLYKRNYYSYVLRASAHMEGGNGSIIRQMRNHWKIIHEEIYKRERRYGL